MSTHNIGVHGDLLALVAQPDAHLTGDQDVVVRSLLGLAIFFRRAS